MGMTDREKVIKGLEHCSEDGCKECPYEQDCTMADGFSELASDALALLKEQEAVEPLDIIDEKYPVGDSNRYKWYRCGKCKEVIPWDANYCLYCGQAVKWE